MAFSSKTHGPQYHEYKKIKDTMLACYEPKLKHKLSMYTPHKKSGNLTTEMLVTETEVRNFVNFFLKHGIKNASLTEKMIKSFNDKEHFLLDTESAGVTKHISHDYGDAIDVISRAQLGTHQLPDGRYNSDMVSVRGIIHENAHNISQKFDVNYLNSEEGKNAYFNGRLEADQSIGEIESKFMEKIFND